MSADERDDLGYDVPLQDCFLECSSGRRFPSNTGVLAANSVALKGIIEASEGDYGDEAGQKRKRHVMNIRIPLSDEDEPAVELLWRLLHDKTFLIDQFNLLLHGNNSNLEDSQPLDTIFELTRLADKYCMDGTAVRKL